MENLNAVIIVGGVIEQNGKYLLVQEAKSKCYGQWNLPYGHLEIGEDICQGAIREIKEEAGCDVELTGICQLDSHLDPDYCRLGVTFAAKITNGAPKIVSPSEILNVKWFTYEQILAMHDQLRNTDIIIGSIEKLRHGAVATLDIINISHSARLSHSQNQECTP